MEVSEKKTFLGNRVTLSKHAKKRFIERWNMEPYILDIAYKAFQNGRNLTEKEFQKYFEKGIIKTGYWSAYYRVYKKFLFIFQRSNRFYVLITMIDFYN